MVPLKKNLSSKDIVYIYLTGPFFPRKYLEIKSVQDDGSALSAY